MAEMLVTGSAGNLGAEVVRALLDAGHEVRGLVRPGRDAALPNGAEAVEGDLDRPATLSGALSGIHAFYLQVPTPALRRRAVGAPTADAGRRHGQRASVGPRRERRCRAPAPREAARAM